MNEDTKRQIDLLKNQLNELKRQFDLLKSVETMPIEIDSSFRARFSQISNSTKVATSEDRAVNEAGIDTYNVLKSPDAFLETRIGGSLYYIPVFT